MALLLILSSVAAVLFAIFYRNRRKQMQVFKDMGIAGPEPNFLLGNLMSFSTKSYYEVFQEWTQKYGRTYGCFEGPTPVLVTSDEHILQQVFVKQFCKFHSRKVFPVQVDPEKDDDVHMFFARGERWKRLRSCVNPAFSSSKMRKMSPVIKKNVDDLMLNVNEECKNEKAFDIHDQFQKLTLDTIFHCAFNVESRALKNPDDLFLKHCKGIIADTTRWPILFLFGFMFPTLHALWIAVYYVLKNIKFNPFFWMEDQITRVIEDRKTAAESEVPSDMLKLMMNAKFQGEYFPAARNQPKSDKFNLDAIKTLSNKEIVAQSLLFLLAGYETTSTSLAYIFYELASNPDVQRKVVEEIEEHFQNKDDIPNYDNVKKLTYLDMVIKETLRKYVVASSVIARECIETTEVEGIVIPKGMLVQVDAWSLHRRADLFGEDPEAFYPERFSPETEKARHPMAWMAFGAGPRMCAGHRFAILQAKIVTVDLLRNFRFSLSTKTSVPLKLREGATVCPKNGVHVMAERRT